MRVYPLAVAVVLLATQATAPAQSPEDAVNAAEQRFEDALARRDRPALESLLADPFTWIHATDARLDTRAVFLDNAASGMGLTRQRNQASTFARTVAIHGDTAITTARVRLRFAGGTREGWFTQSRVYVRRAGVWQLAHGQGTRMYDGPATGAELYGRYQGTFALADGRTLALSWDGDALIATMPSGARSQIFLASPTEEATAAQQRLQFELDADRRPAVVRLMRGDEQVWRAERRQP